MSLFMHWRGSGTDQGLYESEFVGPTNDPPFAVASQLSGRGSLTGPGLATFQGSRFMAWRGIDGDDDLYYATNDGSGWSDQIHLGDRGSGNSPALAIFNGRLFMAWRGAGDDQRLYWASFPDENRTPPWSDQQVLPDRGSFRGPSLAVFSDQLFMAWRGVVGDQHLYWSTFDGSGWSDQQSLTDRGSVDCPMLVPFGPRLFMVWRGGSSIDESDLGLYVSEYVDGVWSPQQLLINTAGHEIGSDSRPGIAVYNSQVWLASVGSVTFIPVGNPESGGAGGSDGGGGVESAPEDARIFVETFDGGDVIGHVLTPQKTDYQPGLCRFRDDHYAGLWELTDGPPWQARHNLTADEYQQTFDDLGAQGYRLVHVNGHAVDGEDRYAAIWFQGGGPAWQARHRLTADEYQQTFDDLGSQGYRLIHVSGYSIDGEDRYAAIWIQEDGPAWQARHRLTADEYQQTFDDLGSQGYRLAKVSGYCANGQDRYAAIWIQEDGPAWQARHRLTADEYQQTFDDLGAQGYRLDHVSGYNVNGEDRYAAIWIHQDGPAWQGRHRLTVDEYQQAFDDLGAQGYRLVDVSGF